MSLKFASENIDRYDALASLSWPSPPGKEPKVIPAGSKVRVISRGNFTTDSRGATLAVNGWSPVDMIRGLLNHSWEIWVRPELERYRTESVHLPDEIRSVLIKREGNSMRLHVNLPVGTGHMVLRPGVSVQKGDDITADMIVDVDEVSPPTHNNKTTQYLLVRFKGEQVSVVFDLRPGQDGFSDYWMEEDRQWYGSALAEQLLAGIYGHVLVSHQHLVSCDLPFSLGLRPAKMNALAEAASKSRTTAEKYLDDHVAETDWKPLVCQWASSRIGHIAGICLKRHLNSTRLASTQVQLRS